MSDDRGPQLVAAMGFFLALSWIFVLMRCYCRIALVKCFGIDDTFCMIAQVLFTTYCGFTAASIVNGVGRHTADVPPQDIPLALKWSYFSDPFYVFCNMTLKFSIGIFLLRICVSKIHRAIIWVVIVVSGIVCVYFGLVALFQCSPVSYFWEQAAGDGAEGTCISPHVLIASTYAYTAMSCWSDWTYCIVPIFMIWKLQMNPRAKLGVCLILGVSSVASIITIVRIPSISALNSSSDFLYNVSDLTLWSIIETGLALLACSSATLRPLIRLFSGKFTSLVPSDIVMRSNNKPTTHDPWGGHVGYSRNGTRINDDEVRIQTDIGATVASIGNNTKNQSRWQEDDHGSGVEADGISNSSQTQLKGDEETGLAVAKSSAGITKTVVVSSRSVRI